MNYILNYWACSLIIYQEKTALNKGERYTKLEKETEMLISIM